jgi:hypothetical protein
MKRLPPAPSTSFLFSPTLQRRLNPYALAAGPLELLNECWGGRPIGTTVSRAALIGTPKARRLDSTGSTTGGGSPHAD